MSSTQSVRSHGNIFHQRKPSLTTICPPSNDKRAEKSTSSTSNKRNSFTLRTSTAKKSWYKKIFDMPAIQLVGWTYVLICFCLSTIHLVNSFSSLDPTASRRVIGKPKVDWDRILLERQASSISTLNEILPETRLSKMFSKSGVNNDFIRPYWFTASIKPNKDALTLTTVVTLDDWDSLVQLADIYDGPISAALLVPSTENINSEQNIEQFTKIRHNYETTQSLRRHVDIHLVLQPGGLTEGYRVIATGGYQESRNLARLFSRTDFTALVPVKLLWLTEIDIKPYFNLLRKGDLLIVPTFGFPNYDGVETTLWPTDKQTIIESVEEGMMGLLDYNYELNNGPTSYSTWKEAREPYLVPNYGFEYAPIFISTRLHHPWCEERFEDHLASCIYTKYLAGANLWVLPNDYAVRSGQEPANSLVTPQQKRAEGKIARKYRIEQCVFYARQFDQDGIFETEKANHVKQECSIALLSLQKQKMISDIVEEEED